MCVAGRGWGKTRTGAEDAAYFGMKFKQSRIAIVAPTYSDARDTCVEGESGLLACLPPKIVRDWNRSVGELYLLNGSMYKLYTAEKPDRLRGPQHHRAWCDELCAWKYAQDTWDMLQFGLRLGDHPQTVITSTPKPLKLLRDLMANSKATISTGSTYDNQGNLPESFLSSIKSRYEGTSLGQQEIYAQVLDDLPGALWSRSNIEANRWRDKTPDEAAKLCCRIVIAIDPATTSGDDADETGIVAVGITEDNHGIVLADESCRVSPQTWAKKAIKLFRRFKADRIVAEVNNGGDMVKSTVQQVDRNIPFKAVHASRGKYVRAEPISAIYEQNRVHHIGVHPGLEDQMCMFTPDNIAQNSPDRADALVWGFSDLFSGAFTYGLLGLVGSEKFKSDTQAELAGKSVVKVEMVTTLAKPDVSPKTNGCPVCGSICISQINGMKRCNQCGLQFDKTYGVPSIPNRANIDDVMLTLRKGA